MCALYGLRNTLNAALTSAALLGVAIAGYWSVRVSEADRLARSERPGSMERALRLAPENSEYWIRVADLLHDRGGDAREFLASAVALNANEANAWIRLGLDAEMRQDYKAAQQFLLEASRVSRQHQPSWTLTNFYFRQNQPEDFWIWAQKALAVSYGDRTPLFRLCWSMTQDAAAILHRTLPTRPVSTVNRAVWRDYLGYLTATERLEAGEPIAAGLLEGAQPGDCPVLLGYANALLESRSVDPALLIWNRLCAGHRLQYEPLAPQAGASLTNGDFRIPFAGAGFDWRAPSMNGVATVRGRSLLHVEFSGKQPESCELVWQYLPIEPERAYTLTFEYQTNNIEPGSGLAWKILDTGKRASLIASSPQLSSTSWKHVALHFTSPGGGRLARLVLAYERMSGTARIDGSIWLRTMKLGFRDEP
jgi:tetratricopeptide (TPR) repeat protein